MDETRRHSISEALRRYRETVTAHNTTTLRRLIDGITAQSSARLSEQTAKDMQVRSLERHVGFPLYGKISRPDEVFTMDLKLDGTRKVEGSRQAWFDTISDHLEMPFPPADFAYLCTLVDVITGPGLCYWQWRQIDMLSAVDSGKRDILNRVIVPARGQDYLEYIWDGFKAAVRIGDAFEGSSGAYMLYCREGEGWAWKYAVNKMDWGSDIYDTLEEFLEFYSHYQEPTEEEVRRAAVLVG